jgi:hypothetical protein
MPTTVMTITEDRRSKLKEMARRFNPGMKPRKYAALVSFLSIK